MHMKKRKERLIRTTGIITLLVMMALNFSHAFNDYGFLTNPMSSPILGQLSTGTSTSTSTSTGEKKGCEQKSSSNNIKSFCNAGSKNSSCDYTVSSWSCAKGDGYWCKEGTITTGYDCNTSYNSSNCGTTTVKTCK